MLREISWSVRICDVGDSTHLKKRNAAELTCPCSASTFPRHGDCACRCAYFRAARPADDVFIATRDGGEMNPNVREVLRGCSAPIDQGLACGKARHHGARDLPDVVFD